MRVMPPGPLGFRFVVENMDIAVSDLQGGDVAGNNVRIKRELEAATAVVRDVCLGEIYRNLHSNHYGVVEQHEPLQRLVALPVVRSGWHGERGKARRVVLLARERRAQVNRECRRPVVGFPEEVVRVSRR